MRQIVIDTETTGLDPKQGHRIIEFAALELVDRRATGRAVHFRVDPEREIDLPRPKSTDDVGGSQEQAEVSRVAAEFVDFARGAEWIIHKRRSMSAFSTPNSSSQGYPTAPDSTRG
jgi:DNA polymerase-3 subunit epsilon